MDNWKYGNTEALVRYMGKSGKRLAKEEERKARADRGKKRIKYDSTLPPKYKSYLMRSNQKGIKMSLSVEEFEHICSLPCVYCGTTKNIGIDRIESSDGYVEGNVQPCCTKCNMMKYTSSHEDFIKQVLKIVKNLNLA